MEIQKNADALEYRARKSVKSKMRFKKALFRLKLISIILLLIIVCVSAALSPLCNISVIEVQESKYYQKSDIIDVTDIIAGDNGFKTLAKNYTSMGKLFSFRFGASEERILKSRPYIKSIEARYSLPGKAVIKMIERVPVCIVPYLGTNLLLDGEAFTVDALEDISGKDLPVIKGVSVSGYELGSVLQTEGKEGLADVYAIISSIDEADKKDNFKLGEALKYIDMGDPSGICLGIDNRIVVKLGNLTDLNYKINFLKQIFFKKIKKDEKGILDFSSGDNPNFISDKK